MNPAGLATLRAMGKQLESEGIVWLESSFIQFNGSCMLLLTKMSRQID